MGSEGPQGGPIEFHVTGFRKFQGVPYNPTEALVAALPAHVGRQGSLPYGATLGSCTVLHVAAAKVEDGLLDLLSIPYKAPSPVAGEREPQAATPAPLPAQRFRLRGPGGGQTPDLDSSPSPGPPKDILPTRVFWVHLGVNSGASRFAIERRAVNEATFRCPDEAGWQPQKEMIAKEDGSLSFSRVTSVPVEWIAEALRRMGFDVAVSDDAGRFVCNYLYYQSLRHAAATGAACLFVHVPSFASVDEGTQLRFVGALLQVLAAC